MALKDKIGYANSWDLEDWQDIHPSHTTAVIEASAVKSCIEAIKKDVINDDTTENFEFIKKSRVKEIIDEATGFEENK